MTHGAADLFQPIPDYVSASLGRNDSVNLSTRIECDRKWRSATVAAAILAAVEGVHPAARTKSFEGLATHRISSGLGLRAVLSAGLEARLYGRPEARRYIDRHFQSHRPGLIWSGRVRGKHPWAVTETACPPRSGLSLLPARLSRQGRRR